MTSADVPEKPVERVKPDVPAKGKGPHPWFGLVRAAIEKRGGRSDIRRISADTGIAEVAVDRVLRQMKVQWPEPGVVELVE